MTTIELMYSPALKKRKMKKLIDDYFGVDCLTHTRKVPYVTARQVYIHCLHKFTSMKLQEIAREVGLTDHSTIIYSVKSIKKRCFRNDAFKNMVIEIESMIE